MAIADELQRRWYNPAATPLWWTLPLAALYGTVTGARRWLYRRRWLHSERLPVPVIVVGNIVAGGAGKTPLTIALAEALRARGWNPGVVSRGYGGSVSGAVLLDARPDPAVAGDEPALIRTRTGARVAVGARRVDAARLLLTAGADVVIADDGLQHYALARDIEIAVVDGVRRFGNGRLLPAGPLREPASRLRGVDFQVCNGGAPVAGEIPMQLVVERVVALADPARTQSLSQFTGQRAHAVAGIGNPARFFGALRAAGIEVVEHAFVDHHRYTRADFDFGDAAPVLMTEKDAIKCSAFAQPNWWAVPATARLPGAWFDAIDARLRAGRGRASA
ncbi:MAG: tetraacyldisaccharide 4'-kinase [Rhodanobacteraceae bacterium]|nr:MAG: tetraacyldisaccharide 4'-kinase [Rhodanobacteraceae bacterium]